MTWDNIQSFISTIGFPIFVAVFFLLQNYKQDERNAAALDKMQQALDQNTLAIRELTIKLDKGGD